MLDSPVWIKPWEPIWEIDTPSLLFFVGSFTSEWGTLLIPVFPPYIITEIPGNMALKKGIQ